MEKNGALPPHHFTKVKLTIKSVKMQHMYDNTQGVSKRDTRGINVDDITGGNARVRDFANTAANRVAPIRPKIMDYDIINPTSDKLRMSSYGKHVLSSREGVRRSIDAVNSPVAGKQFIAKPGQGNLEEIWPVDQGQRFSLDEKARVLSTKDINVNLHGNARMARLKQQDEEQIR